MFMPFNENFLSFSHMSSTQEALLRTQDEAPSWVAQDFESKCRRLCQMADSVVKVWCSSIINVIILKILEKLTHSAVATSNQRCQAID